MDDGSRLLSTLILIPGILFEGIVRGRNWMYSAGLLRSRRLPAPVLSIGNLTLGGSGKTPLVVHIAVALQKMGAVPALLSRGYGRRSPREEHIVAPGNEIPSPALNLGDEPALIRMHVPGMWLGISSNRYSAGLQILQRCSRPVFVLDDGFQHRKLGRDLDVVVIDTSQPIQANRIFPRGTLREPFSGVRRAGMVLLNCSDPAADCSEMENAVRAFRPDMPVLHCCQTIRSFVPFGAWRQQKRTECAHTPVSAFLVAAVGNPRRFQADVQRCGIGISGTRLYRDHAGIARDDWSSCAAAARQSKADAIVTTEKDAIKLTHPPDFPLLVAVQETSIREAVHFEAALRTLLERSRA